jgi:hypothetical protein
MKADEGQGNRAGSQADPQGARRVAQGAPPRRALDGALTGGGDCVG